MEKSLSQEISQARMCAQTLAGAMAVGGGDSKDEYLLCITSGNNNTGSGFTGPTTVCVTTGNANSDTE